MIPKKKDFLSWYKKIILDSGLAIESPIEGCAALLPYGYKLWERIKILLGKELELLGYEDYYFPLFIPERFFKKNKEHFNGFFGEALSVSSVGHEKFAEPLFIRPTSEAIIYPTLKKTLAGKNVHFPLRVNQWCSIVRWEKRKPTVPLIRDREFLWQEVHSLHTTAAGAKKETEALLNVYEQFLKERLAISTFKGIKPGRRKFPGAVETLALETLSLENKSLQIATSHYLGDNFSKPYGLRYGGQYLFQSCAGMTTRLLGAIAAIHSDEKGLVMPPAVAPYEIGLAGKTSPAILKALNGIRATKLGTEDDGIKRGIPLILKGNTIIRRDLMERILVGKNINQQIKTLLSDIQSTMLKRATISQKSRITETSDRNVIREKVLYKKGGCVIPWCGNNECYFKLKKESGGSIRLVWKNKKTKPCVSCNKNTGWSALFAQAY